MPNEPCLWGEDDDGMWETSCGHAFEFNDGDPADNAFLFCPFCGKQLKQLVYEEEPDEEEPEE
jgi:hypothetical protein